MIVIAVSVELSMRFSTCAARDVVEAQASERAELQHARFNEWSSRRCGRPDTTTDDHSDITYPTEAQLASTRAARGLPPTWRI